MNTSQRSIAQCIAEEIPDLDTTLPEWARRNNPIVRRQLGDYWRVFPPEVAPIITWYLIYVVALVAATQIQLIYLVIMITVMLGVVGFPLILFNYAKALIDIGQRATTGMASEYENDTINLLRATPYTTREIVLSKVSAAVWRHMDTLTITLAYTVTLGMTLIIAFFLNLYSPDDMPLVASFMSLMILASSLIRLPLEMFMVASIGVMSGVAARSRYYAFMTTVFVTFFYFLMLNMMRLIPMAWPTRLIVEGVLPVVLPVIIIWGTVRFTVNLVGE